MLKKIFFGEERKTQSGKPTDNEKEGKIERKKERKKN
jgi:hypothetical protein